MAVHWRKDRFVIDYRPHGRNGKRVRLKLPKSIVSLAEAQEIERSLKAARNRKREDPLAPQDATVDQMFPGRIDAHITGRRYAGPCGCGCYAASPKNRFCILILQSQASASRNV